MNHSLARIARHALWLALLLAASGTASAAADADQITAVMKGQFDQPDRPLQVGPVSVEGNFAISGWTQGEAGGRALLQRMRDRWQITLCAGDALLQPATLEGAGLAADATARLLQKVRSAEAALTASRRQQFARFRGAVAMGHAGPQHSGLGVTGAWARATPPGTTVGAAYFAVTNHDDTPDTLLGATTPAAARVELHRTEVRDGLSMMRPAGEMQIAPGQTLRVAPGGLHVMLNGLVQPLVAGTRVPLTLRFRRSGDLVVDLEVLPLTAAAPDMTGHGAHAGHPH